MAQSPEKTLILPFHIDPDLNYKQQPVNIAFVEPDNKKPLHVFLIKLFQDAFEAGGDACTVIKSDGKFPQDANMGISIVDDGLDKERLPRALYGKHEKPREGKKVVYLFTVPVLPDNANMEDDSLSPWMRRLMAKNASHNIVVVEGEAYAAELQFGARAVVSTMEGDTQIITYDGDKKTFIHNIAQRLRLQAGAHMVTKREGIKVTRPTFYEWSYLPQVQVMAPTSRLLAQRGYLWDLNLREDIGRIQTEMILRILGQAGVSEGNMADIVPDFVGGQPVMAITETGIRKTRINPARGEVVAVPELTQNGVRYLIMNGFPESHPLTFLRYPSRETLRTVTEGMISAFRRRRLWEYVKGIFKGESPVDHPSSVEAFENGHLFRFTALLADSQVSSLPEYLQNLNDEFKMKNAIPVIPPGVKIAANATIHTHLTPEDKQQDELINGVPLALAQEDMRRFGFFHTPPCGSAEAAIFLLRQVYRSYELYGFPQNINEMRFAHLPGHGVLAWGYNGMEKLAEQFAYRVQFKPHVARW